MQLPYVIVVILYNKSSTAVSKLKYIFIFHRIGSHDSNFFFFGAVSAIDILLWQV